MASWCARVKDMMVYLTLSRFSLSKPQVERVFYIVIQRIGLVLIQRL